MEARWKSAFQEFALKGPAERRAAIEWYGYALSEIEDGGGYDHEMDLAYGSMVEEIAENT